MAFDLSERHQALNHQMILRIAQTDYRLKNSAEGYKALNQGYRVGLHGYLHCMYDQIVTTEEMTPERQARLNEQISLYLRWVEPKAEDGFKDRTSDGFFYHMMFVSNKMRYLNDENQAVADAYLANFPKEDIKQVMYENVTRSETQQIIVDLAK